MNFPRAAITLRGSGHSQRASKKGVFARRDTAPDRQSRHEPQCVFGLEVAANKADTCAWCTFSTAAASVLWKHER